MEIKHKELDKHIDQLYKHTSDELSIKKLKKEKLLLKQEIVKLTNQLGEQNG